METDPPPTEVEELQAQERTLQILAHRSKHLCGSLGVKPVLIKPVILFDEFVVETLKKGEITLKRIATKFEDFHITAKVPTTILCNLLGILKLVLPSNTLGKYRMVIELPPLLETGNMPKTLIFHQYVGTLLHLNRLVLIFPEQFGCEEFAILSCFNDALNAGVIKDTNRAVILHMVPIVQHSKDYAWDPVLLASVRHLFKNYREQVEQNMTRRRTIKEILRVEGANHYEHLFNFQAHEAHAGTDEEAVQINYSYQMALCHIRFLQHMVHISQCNREIVRNALMHTTPLNHEYMLGPRHYQQSSSYQYADPSIQY